MVDRIKAAVDARTDENFVIMARTDALAVEGLDSAIERAVACVEAGADAIFPEAMTDMDMYRKFVDAVKVPVLANITEFGATPCYAGRTAQRRRRHGAVPAVGVPRHEQGGRERLPGDPPRRHPEERGRHHDADAREHDRRHHASSRSSTRCSPETEMIAPAAQPLSAPRRQPE
jgi:hypothetical protein